MSDWWKPCRDCGKKNRDFDKIGPRVLVSCSGCHAKLAWLYPGEFPRGAAIETTMPFGKHAGRRLGDLPQDYLRWCRDNLKSPGWLLRESLEALVE